MRDPGIPSLASHFSRLLCRPGLQYNNNIYMCKRALVEKLGKGRKVPASWEEASTDYSAAMKIEDDGGSAGRSLFGASLRQHL